MPCRVRSILTVPQFPGNKIDAVITGKRHREVGLVVPAKYIFQTEDKRCAEIVERELMKRKGLFPTVKFQF